MIVPGNTLESFAAAVEAGVDTIELDVLWLPDAHLPLEQRAPLVVAHDWEDAERRTPLALTEALDAFLEPPLDQVEIDLDVKLPGREEELVDALRERGLIERSMISTMEMHTLKRVLELEPKLRRGWTYPESDQGLDRRSAGRRRRWPPRWSGCATSLPGLAAQKLPQFGVEAMWVYHPLVSARLGPHLRARRGRADRLDGRRRGADASACVDARRRPASARTTRGYSLQHRVC